MLYQGETWWWIAFWVGSLVAMTDFIDGYLARKYGPTVLGGLLDPIADKVFIAAFFLPLVDLELVPAWTVAMMFVREFMVTGIRSAYKQRGMSMKTSYFAKVKTWVQMQAVFYMMLVVLLPPKTILITVCMIIVVGALLLTAIVSAKRKKLFVSGIIMAACCGGAAAIYALFSAKTTLEITMYITVAVTWLSGADYLLAAFPQLRAAGDFNRSDAVRLLGALTLPILAVIVVLHFATIMIAPILVLIALELAVGGLDNLLSHYKKAANAIAWGARAIGAALLLGGALGLAQSTQQTTLAETLIWTAMAVTTLGVTIEFWRGRDVYLENAGPLEELESFE